MRTDTDNPRRTPEARRVPRSSGVLSDAQTRQRIALGLRGVTAAGVLLSADVHLALWATGFKDIDTIGPLFMLNAVGGFLIGVAVLVWRHWLTLLAAAGFGVATLFAFYLSVTVGLFGLQETAGGVQQVTAEVAEYVALVGAGLAWLFERRRNDELS